MNPALPMIQPPPFDAIVALGIGGIAVLMAGVALAVVARYHRPYFRKATIGIVVWMGLSATAATTGLLTRFDLTPPPMAGMMVLVVAMALGIGLSAPGRTLAAAVPLVPLVALQTFRLPLELVMHRAARLSIMPVELSFSGYNFDILTGIGALVLAVLFALRVPVPRWAVWLWNVWGIGCLLVIAFIALATSPMVRAFGDAPAHLNTWVLFFPYVWLPVVLVTLALLGHLLLTRHLLQPSAPH
jgi:hypothetical protein